MSGCRGISPLTARLEDWQTDLCSRPGELADLLEEHGSPVNLIAPEVMERNAGELQSAAAASGVDLRIFFARKANKALALVDEARSLELGIDVASERELRQVLDRGVAADDVMVTAAVKPRVMLELCASSGITVAVDNEDELVLLAEIAVSLGAEVPVALRLAPAPAPGRNPTRFGMTVPEIGALLDRHWPTPGDSPLRIDGVHFHLDGYSAGERVEAIGESLGLIDRLRTRGHLPSFIDMGGGIPMSYLEDRNEWDEFWRRHSAGLLDAEPRLTFEGHGLGLSAADGEVGGTRSVYPYWQSPVRGEWLAEVLASTVPGGHSVSSELRSRDLQLRCEPGRSLLDGAGMTVASVEFRKQRSDGTWLVGLAMNRTQCRSTSEDFMVDPMLIRPPASRGSGRSTGPIDAFLVGAYCIERELLTLRKLHFTEGVEPGDLVVFPNTAGYLMHILESASHQIPLARNLIVGEGDAPALDDIDRPAAQARADRIAVL